MERTIKTRVLQALEDLSRKNLEKFCFHLRNRGDKPEIRTREVEKKSPVEITDLMVSKFTAVRAVKVTVETLRLIDCNQEAETLESKTKACVDTGDPIFRKTSDGKLNTKPSQEAENHAARPFTSKAVKGASVKMMRPEEVEAEAKAQVLSEGGDPGNDRLVLSRYVIQFGKYKGQNFKWLLENDLTYAALIVAEHQRERKHSMIQSPHMAHKDSLTQYVIAYHELSEELRYHHAYLRAKQRSLQPGQEGMALLGFGAHRWETLQGLYESKDLDKISYVKYLRRMESECTPGSKMVDAIRYILQRDQELAAAGTAPSRPFTRSFCRGPRKRKSNRTSSSRSVQGKWRRTGSKTQQTCLLRF
ncbi:uncharacterized protein [Paralichthys olivaceus]|uniref:uncharacterized protein isoform X2 n=1 Tax=Paralichthys olivaceus TaxID=8255 RepID=UPI003750C041